MYLLVYCIRLTNYRLLLPILLLHQNHDPDVGFLPDMQWSNEPAMNLAEGLAEKLSFLQNVKYWQEGEVNVTEIHRNLTYKLT